MGPLLYGKFWSGHGLAGWTISHSLGIPFTAQYIGEGGGAVILSSTEAYVTNSKKFQIQVLRATNRLQNGCAEESRAVIRKWCHQ